MNAQRADTKAPDVVGSPVPSGEKLGLIAGHGRFPILLAQAAREKGFEVVAIAVEGEASDELAQHVDRIFWLGAGDIRRAIATFQAEGVRELVMAGKVRKQKIFELEQVEKPLAAAIGNLQARGDDAVLRAIAGQLERGGLRVREAASLVESLVPKAGVLTRRQPNERELADVEFGAGIARQLAGLGVGQTVIVKTGVIVAVEAIEGTDAAILRGGACAGAGTVAIKVSGPKQDMRFDMPVVGPGTVRSLVEARASCLAMEAGRTILLEQAEVVQLADEADICLLAV
jgi:hypothetical protein